MDKTPRTDRAAFTDDLRRKGIEGIELVNAKFARQLETELSAANAQLAEYKRDAERYRLLRNETYVEAYYIDGAGGVDTTIRFKGSGQFLDAAMDQTEQKKSD